ncbi:unnamed protein product [Peronospora belbahrii]|uniref:C3HC-type domain-containing protein n=1 Tax=Peronospora belbahrii TaxID=622444 RepID=A0AAU9L6F2_9STRA|nr:unnamed protein product [Peronospora belbahrii]CAH0517491.1 unnamed protein product [Peronospora belbahrii]
MAAQESSQMETFLAAWNDATTPLDTRIREHVLMFTSDSDPMTLNRQDRMKTSAKCNKITDSCRPWEHGDFLARVDSFSIASWFAKPDIISVFECARCGWRNTASDQLYCACCNQFLCFKIDSKLSESGALNVAKTFAGQLVTGHTELCPWRGNPSPRGFMMLPIATKRQVYEMFVCRLEEDIARLHKDTELQKQMECVKIADDVTFKILQEANGTAGVAVPLDIATLTSKLFSTISNQDKRSVNSKALLNAGILIVSGWQFDKKEGSQANTLHCSFCNRRWQVLPTTPTKEGVGKREPTAKRMKVEIDWSVDSLSQHRHFCPWIVDRQSTGVDDYGELDPKLWEFVKLPGWKQYAQALVLLEQLEVEAVVAIDPSDATANKCGTGCKCVVHQSNRRSRSILRRTKMDDDSAKVMLLLCNKSELIPKLYN